MATREILARIEQERREQMDFAGFQRKDPTREALAKYRAEIDAKRGHAVMPSGGLFDECGKAQQDLFSP